jgi:hypothetical protein
MRKEDGIDNRQLIDNYDEMIFTSFRNKNKSFGLSKMNFELGQSGLVMENEKGILYLSSMRICGNVGAK